MSDDADLAQRHEAFRRELGLRAARAQSDRLSSPSHFGLCHACGDPIDAARRAALPGARYCLPCQAAAERRLRIPR